MSLSTILLYFFSKQQFNNLQEEKNQLTKTKDLLETIIENAPISIFWKDINGAYQGSNKRLLELINLNNKEELIGKKDSDLNFPEKEEFVYDDKLIMDTKKAKLNYTEKVTINKNIVRIVNTSKVPLIDENGHVIGILALTQDITDQVNNLNQLKEQEKLIIQQSRLASMGEMIANIAHQWRQPLSIISTLATGIKLEKELKISDEKNEMEALDIINQNTQYLSKTIDDFRNYFKKSNYMNSIFTNDLLEKTLKLISSRLKDKNIEIILNTENIEIETYENELVQIYINIINNAIDAFENFKNLDSKKYIFIENKKVDTFLEIEIKDNAGGIDDEIINKIFEPYFTTKDETQGTGLGLFMCNELVTKHLKGNIQAINTTYTYLDKKYKGTIFKIVLPL
ncbi:ATP-binding protein [Arcobacter sp. s6]|uniref:PAS domain-containing sensor histidine kinase n=1 Tax=Arcobacter sp. s6 TaxID=3230363 RepID=UPI0034A0347B